MSSEPYALYHYYKSICSLMVRYCVALSRTVDDTADLKIIERPIDIMRGAQLSEDFLVDINPRGQVPVLTHPTLLPKPIGQSLDITAYLYQFFPNLNPAQHAAEISRLLEALHSINYFSLSYGGQSHVILSQEKAIKGLISKPGISPTYKAALEYKLKFTENEGVAITVPAKIPEAEAIAHQFLAEMSAIMADSAAKGSEWLLGTEHPTALDAHMIVFLVRLQDVNRVNMIDDVLTAYLKRHTDSETWKTFMNGETTYY